MKRPLTNSIILTTLVTAAVGCGDGEGALSDAVTGFGGTGLILVMWLLFKHFGPKETRGSK